MSTNISDNLCNLHLIIQLSTACKPPSFSDALIPFDCETHVKTSESSVGQNISFDSGNSNDTNTNTK